MPVAFSYVKSPPIRLQLIQQPWGKDSFAHSVQRILPIDVASRIQKSRAQPTDYNSFPLSMLKICNFHPSNRKTTYSCAQRQSQIR